MYERATAPSTTGLYHRHVCNRVSRIMALPFRSQISRQPLAVTGYRVSPQQTPTIVGIQRKCGTPAAWPFQEQLTCAEPQCPTALEDADLAETCELVGAIFADSHHDPITLIPRTGQPKQYALPHPSHGLEVSDADSR